jgi:hypothetical protein
MGKYGAMLGKFVGSHAAKYVSDKFKGNKYHKHIEKGLSAVGTHGGEYLGGLLPFKKGGKIKKTGKAYMHKGEFVLPKGVHPTTHQIKIVKKKGGRL